MACAHAVAASPTGAMATNCSAAQPLVTMLFLSRAGWDDKANSGSDGSWATNLDRELRVIGVLVAGYSHYWMMSNEDKE